MRILKRVATLLIVLLAVGRAEALEKFDFEQKFFIEFGPEVKDHSLLLHEGTYHLFYLRGNPAVDIGHAVSPDLIHWTIEPPVMDVEPGEWDEHAMWAPQVIPNGNQWIMYYTGVNSNNAQRAGLALSSDLYTWTKIDQINPVYTPDVSWALWSEDEFSHGRDPFVFSYNGMHYMINTAKTPYNKGAIALASSPNLFFWEDEGPLYVHDTWHVLESLQMIQHDGTWHLFFTEEVVNGTSWATNGGGDPLVGWDLTNSTVIDFGHAPEVNELTPGTYTFSRHTTTPMPGGGAQFVLRFDELKWTATYPFVNKPWPLAPDWSWVYGNAFSTAPTFLDNAAFRGSTVDPNFEGYCWVNTYENYQGPLGFGAAGSANGEGRMGSIQSRTFTLSGNSIKLLVGGTNSPDDCYVALYDAATDEELFRETGKDTDAMDWRKWNMKPYKGNDVYLVIADNSTTGHICTDEIQESWEIVASPPPGHPPGDKKGGPGLRGMRFETPKQIALRQNVPNPFNPTTTISYDLPTPSNVSLDVYNVNGQRVRTLVSGRITAGTHTTSWDSRNDAGVSVPSGVYFYRLTVDGRTVATRKMMLLK